VSKSCGHLPKILPAFGMIPIVLGEAAVSGEHSSRQDSGTHSPRRANLGTLSYTVTGECPFSLSSTAQASPAMPADDRVSSARRLRDEGTHLRRLRWQRCPSAAGRRLRPCPSRIRRRDRAGPGCRASWMCVSERRSCQERGGERACAGAKKPSQADEVGRRGGEDDERDTAPAVVGRLFATF
jgi:hypothetical protein